MIDSKLIFPLVVLLPLVKTDMVILSGILMLYYYFMDKSKNKYTLIITSVCSIIMLIIVNKVHGNYGYLNLFNLGHINQNKTLYPADIVASTRISDYVLPYIWLIRDALNNSQAVFYMIAILIFIYSKKIGYDIKYKYPLFVIPFVYVLLHIVAFPTYTERYFIFPIMLILIGITHFLKYQLAELSSNN
jgi:hypothetical protein